MGTFRWLLLVFLLVPIGEIYVLLEVGQIVGPLTTVILVVFTAVLGAHLMRAQGFATLARIQDSVGRGEMPAGAVIEGALILIAGALLLTPGFITDAFGFACLVPPLREWMAQRALGRMIVRVRENDDPHGEGRVIEGQFRRESDN